MMILSVLLGALLVLLLAIFPSWGDEDAHARKGRYPYFWLDKLCIDQANIQEVPHVPLCHVV